MFNPTRTLLALCLTLTAVACDDPLGNQDACGGPGGFDEPGVVDMPNGASSEDLFNDYFDAVHTLFEVTCNCGSDEPDACLDVADPFSDSRSCALDAYQAHADVMVPIIECELENLQAATACVAGLTICDPEDVAACVTPTACPQVPVDLQAELIEACG